MRNNFDIPKSTSIKNTAIKSNVESTTSVYLLSSLRLGQLVLRISENTLLKNVLSFPIQPNLRIKIKILYD